MTVATHKANKKILKALHDLALTKSPIPVSKVNSLLEWRHAREATQLNLLKKIDYKHYKWIGGTPTKEQADSIRQNNYARCVLDSFK